MIQGAKSGLKNQVHHKFRLTNLYLRLTFFSRLKNFQTRNSHIKLRSKLCNPKLILWSVIGDIIFNSNVPITLGFKGWQMSFEPLLMSAPDYF